MGGAIYNPGKLIQDPFPQPYLKGKIDIKKQYIQPLHYLLADLGFYFGIDEPSNTIEIIDRLLENNIHQNCGALLKEAAMNVWRFRALKNN